MNFYMKTYIFIIYILLAMLPCASMAQEYNSQCATYNDDGSASMDQELNLEIGVGYGRMDCRSSLDISLALGLAMNGKIEAGLVFDHANTEKYTDKMLDDRFMYEVTTGGIYLCPIMKGHRKVSLQFPTKMTLGGARYSNRFTQGYNDVNGDYMEYEDFACEDRCFVFMIEPGARASLRISDNMKLSLGVSYRMTGNVNLRYAEDKSRIAGKGDLNGMFYHLTFTTDLFY